MKPISRIIITLSLLIISFPSQALKFSPMYAEMSPTGRYATQSFRVENDTDSMMPVMVSLHKRYISIEGKERLIEDEDNFIIYPQQMILKPKQKQTIRVQWVGNTAPIIEQAFRIIAEQMPIQLTTKKKSGVQVVLRYVGSVYIVPRGARSKIEISKVAPVKPKCAKDNETECGATQLGIFFKNKGKRHTTLDKLKLELTGTDKSGKKRSLTLSGDQLKGVSEELVLAKKVRRFRLAWPKEFKKGEIQVDFSFKAPPEEEDR